MSVRHIVTSFLMPIKSCGAAQVGAAAKKDVKPAVLAKNKQI